VSEGAANELIASHVGSEVVEIHLPDGVDGDALVTRLGDGPWRSERVGQMLYLYLRDGGTDGLLHQLGDLEVARRHATLEDVFLTLTGHTLRD